MLGVWTWRIPSPQSGSPLPAITPQGIKPEPEGRFLSHMYASGILSLQQNELCLKTYSCTNAAPYTEWISIPWWNVFLPLRHEIILQEVTHLMAFWSNLENNRTHSIC